MNFEAADWIILAVFTITLTAIAVVTKRITRSVAGFLSSERLAGRYLLTVAFGMAFASCIGLVGSWESSYRNGLALLWWGLLALPINLVVAMSGWVTYRYRETRALTMAQFLETRYSRKFRVFAGLAAFFSGILNCAVFPMVTAHFVIHFIGLPQQFEWLGFSISTYHGVMLLLVSTAVLLAISGGQITVMVTDFFIGTVANFACIALIAYVLFHIGMDDLLDTLAASGTATPAASLENIEKLTRPEGASMLNPFKIGKLPNFGVLYFVLLTFVNFVQTGIWQGGAGYLTAARTPHEGKMGNVLGQWRWMIFTLAIVLVPCIVYTVMWNPRFETLQLLIAQTASGIADPHLQNQMFVPLALGKILPAGLLGLFAVFLIGAAVSTDDSYYHSWGSTFLQDVIMPFRKKPFEKEQHLKYLRWSIIGVGAFAFLFSSIWELKEFIQMWFQITASIYVGGACCAIIGGLYWSRGTTQGAWAGMLTGSALSVGSIVLKQVVPDLEIAGHPINGQHLGVFSILISITVYIITSLATCRTPYNMDKLLHRGTYSVGQDQQAAVKRVPFWEKLLGITKEFSRSDKLIFIGVNCWMVGWTLVFIIGTFMNMTREVPTETWRWWWGTIHLPILFITAGLMTLWLTFGSTRDVFRLFRDLKNVQPDEHDDGTTHQE